MNLIEEMKNCEQTKGQSVYDHGLSVYKYYEDFPSNFGLMCREPELTWKYSDSISQNINLTFDHCYSADIMYEYLVYHDCGKPFCKEEIDGKIHFPNHAEVSAKTYYEYFGPKYSGCNEYSSRSSIVYDLIRDDMCLHTLSADQIALKLNKWTIEHSISLIISAWCELNSNAQMFGGFDTISFKSKFKQLDRRTKQILKHWSNNDGI